MGDGYCDDYVNNVECSWDDGDCCGDNVDKTYCTQCQCLDPTHQGGMYSTELMCIMWKNYQFWNYFSDPANTDEAADDTIIQGTFWL